MKTLALKFDKTYAANCETLTEHQEIIDELGYVWLGKLLKPICEKTISEIVAEDSPKILLLQSGNTSKYWLDIEEFSEATPPLGEYPAYYGDNANKIKTWVKVKGISEAEPGVLSKCVVSSSRQSLAQTLKFSVSPYFIIDYQE